MSVAQRGSRALQKMENSGNEAKKYLKTKEVAILNDANYARFARELAPIGPQKQHIHRVLRKRTELLASRAEAWTMTSCRLHKSRMV